MIARPMRKIKIVYCYDAADDVLQKELDKHLSALRHLGSITTWFDGKIQPGLDWKHEIETQVSEADIILLLVSADFMASKLLRESEMQRALERHKVGTTHVIPIILRPVDWEETIIGTLQALPKDGNPITLWNDRDQAFLEVVRGIREVINTLIPKQDLSQHETSILYPELIDQEEARRFLAGNQATAVRKMIESLSLLVMAFFRVLSQIKTSASHYIQHRGMLNKRILFILILALLVTFGGVGIYYSGFGTRKPSTNPGTPTLPLARSTLTVTRASATATKTPTPPIPHLKQSYSGISKCQSNCPVGYLGMQLVITSQDQQGHFTATADYGEGVIAYWTGTITANGSITAQTNRPYHYTGTFQGTLDPEGRIDGLETYSNASDVYHDTLS